MCAIAGIINPRDAVAAESIVRAMTAAMAHRGPDGSGCFASSDAVLGHRRLAVIDPSGGVQPLFSEDRSVVAVVNGEIYNFRELRAELERLGHRMASRCDSEVLVHLYEEYGSDCVRRLEGMFAAAVFDCRRRKLLLLRDRFGKKPLLYFMRGETLVFASEFCGLECHPDLPREPDLAAIGDFLSLQYIPGPDTVYRKVRKLMPAHLLEYRLDTGAVSIRRYWELDYRKKEWNLRFADAVHELRRLLENAVAARLESDVPLGVFLSGGIDSTIVAGLTARKLSPRRCAAFTIGFDHAAYDERQFAAAAAVAVGRFASAKLDHRIEVAAPCGFELLKKLVYHTGEPYADASLLPTYQLCSFARRSITVALSGDGADEIFCGYERYSAMRLIHRLDWFPAGWLRKLCGGSDGRPAGAGERSTAGRLLRFVRLFGVGEPERYFSLLDRCPVGVKSALWPVYSGRMGTAAQQFAAPQWFGAATDPVERCSELDVHTYLPGDILTKIDSASMAVGLEVRSPFLDREVVEFAARLPLAYKLRGWSRKRILRAAFADLLPGELLHRPKRGFGVPVADWLRGAWRQPVEEELLHSGRLTGFGIEIPEVEKLWREHQRREGDWSYLLWSLLNLSLFAERGIAAIKAR